MESDFEEGRDEASEGASAERARELLASVGTDGARLAAALVTPWWYHPLLATIVATMVAAQALPNGLGLGIVVFGIISMALLPRVYAKRYGVAVSKPAGRRSRGFMIALIVLMAVSFVAGLAVKLAALPTAWVLVPMVIAFVGVIVIGRSYDAALRQELARNGTPNDSGAGK
ncbi:hypothetical protein NHL51_07210 [Leucobacter sp. gxy201]|uniref:hypothetical protein n=1 Tax=Leucobacter sp. gxy201 TaxID=2957200 RepID=UPI003D9FBE82